MCGSVKVELEDTIECHKTNQGVIGNHRSPRSPPQPRALKMRVDKGKHQLG